MMKGFQIPRPAGAQFAGFLFLACVAYLTLQYPYVNRAQDSYAQGNFIPDALREYFSNISTLSQVIHARLNNLTTFTKTTATPMRDQIVGNFTGLNLPSYKMSHHLDDATHPAPSICPPNLDYTTGLPVTALFSFPGSGNTWVRHLLQMATGVYTGSVYVDHYLKMHGFPGDGRYDGTVIAIKSHEWDAKTLAMFQRAILIIREPAAAIMAEYNRHHAGGHTRHVDPKYLRGEKFHTTLLKMAEDWRLRNTAWLLDFPGPLHLIDYRDLQENFSATFTRVLHFLNWQVTDEQLNCLMKYQEGNYHRNNSNVNLSDLFGEHHYQQLQDYKTNISTLIEHRVKKGYSVSGADIY